MASSSLKNEKKRVRDLQIERTKQSIEQLSIDCESNCSKVWQEFNAVTKAAKKKAEELCCEMKRKTTEEQSKWKQSVQEKENLVEKAEKWLVDLVDTDDDKKEVVSRIESLRAELFLRLHESFAPVEEGHFVVTFPEWRQRSLQQLEKEMVDITIETWHPGKLKLQSELRLQDSIVWIHSFAVSDEDDHVFVVDGSNDLIKEFGETGEFVNQSLFKNEGKKFFLKDICRLFNDILAVCGVLWSRGSVSKGRILVLARNKSPSFLEKVKIIDTKEIEFHSLCQMDEKLFVCDYSLKKILCFSKEGTQIKRIQLQKSPESGSPPLLRADPMTGNLLGTKCGMSEFFVWNQNGQILQTVKTEKEIFDFCGNEFGHFYFCNLEGIFSIFPKKVQHKFPKKSGNGPRIFVSRKKFFICFQNNGKNLMKIFKID